ncbi:MAG: hypothetical protein ACE5JP_17025 [Candidatus Bipolaricaulia bacterium]
MSKGRRKETQREVRGPESLEPTTLSSLLINSVSSPKWKKRIIIALAVIGSIIVLVSFLGSASDIVANILAIAYEESRQPHLEYSYKLLFSEGDYQVYADAVEQLTGEFLGEVHEYTQTRTATTHPEAVSAVLPMTTTIPVHTTSVKALVHNNGAATATKVRVFFTMDRPINSHGVESLEPFRVVQGGVGRVPTRLARRYTLRAALV